MKFTDAMLLGGFVAFGTVGGVAYAQGGPPMQAARAAMEKACGADIASLCAGKTGREANECLSAAGDKVSPICRDATSKMVRPGAGGAVDARSGPRSPPSDGGVMGTVDSVSPSGFAISTAAGRKLNIATAASTTYRKGKGSASAGAITTGESVIVLGKVGFGADGLNATTITASEVIVQPAGKGAAVTPPAAPFQGGGAPAPEKRVGQIPADYVEGGGTIVNGVEANKATEAALASTFYGGGLINRVVSVGHGIYECHNVTVSWPHHIFVNADFKVVGAF